MADPIMPAKQHLQLDGDTEDKIEPRTSPKKPGRTTLLLISLNWLVWLLAITSDLLLSIRREFFPGTLFIKSPIVRYIYTNYIYRWPHGGYYVLDPFFMKWSPAIVITKLASSTACMVLQFGLLRHMRPWNDDVTDALVMLWMAGCLLAGSALGLTSHECEVIVLPSSWLKARAVQMVCLRRGRSPAEVSKERGRMVFVTAAAVFGVVYVWVLGAVFNIVAVPLFVEAGWRTWKWFNGRSREELDVGRDIEVEGKAI